MDDSPQGQAIAALGQATANTHRCIAALAVARDRLHTYRADRMVGAEEVSDAAHQYRNLEAELTELVSKEMDAHIALLDATLEGGDNANTNPVEHPADSSGRSG